MAVPVVLLVPVQERAYAFSTGWRINCLHTWLGNAGGSWRPDPIVFHPWPNRPQTFLCLYEGRMATIPALSAVAQTEPRDDRRSSMRYPIVLELQYTLVNEGGVECRGSGRTLDISSSGVLF